MKKNLLKSVVFTAVAAVVGTTVLAQNVLIIYDDLPTNTNTLSLQTALINAGYNADISAVSESAWDNTNPSLSTYDAVIHLNGTTYSNEMPTAGQNALVDFVENNSGAYVHFEWNAYQIGNSQMLAMQDLVLFDRFSGSTGSLTYTKVTAQANHPVLVNVPDSFQIYGGSNVGNLHVFSTDPSLLLMTEGSNDALAIREFGSGHVLGFHHAGNYSGTPLADVNVQEIIINFVAYATGCGVTAHAVQTNVSCFGANDGMAEVLIFGNNSPFTINWSTTDSGSVISSLTPGVYSVTVTDSTGCISIDSFEITEPAQIIMSVDTIENVVCSGDETGAALISASGGVGSFTYFWSNGDSTTLADSLTNGWYYVTITDSTGCMVVDSLVVSPSFYTPQPALGDTLDICPDFPVTLDVTFAGATYLWSTGDADSAIVVADSGVYSVTVDNNGCIGYDTVVVELHLCLGVDELNSNVFSVYPNPTDGVLYFNSSNSSAITKVEVFNVLGELVLTNSQTSLTNVDLSHLDAGSYLVKLSDSSSSEVVSVVLK